LKQSIRLHAFAKINLGLKILGKRSDSYHEIRTVYQTVTLCDRLEISLLRGGSGIRVRCDDPSLPSGRGNLVYRACAAWKRVRGFSGGVRVRLDKRIPAGSGLGGASSDAAAALLGLERLTGDRLDWDERVQLTAVLGSDVPFFLYGGRGLGIGRGEEVYPLSDLPPRRCLIVFPGFAVSTAEAYRMAGRGLGRRLTKVGKGDKIPGFGAWSQIPLKGWGPAENDFERVVFAKWPELAGLKGQLIRAGAKVASLSGSGSALYALFDSASQLTRAARLVPKGWQTFRVRTLPRREYQRQLFASSGE
jgi:4-diphosphocytidyl-2-C-methyl-D-erythritol kinase